MACTINRVGQQPPASGDEFRQSLQAIGADPVRTRDYLLRVSMIASLRRAEELG